MKGRLKRRLKSCTSLALAISMVSAMIQIPVKAEAADVYLPEIEIGEDILSSDVFYLTAANAQLQEGADERYLLRIARGGDCASASGVTVKIADLTAKYGEDYTISVVGSDAEVNDPEDNESLIERMEGQEYTESELVSEEEYLARLESDDTLYDETVNAVNGAIEYIESESGVSDAEDAGFGQEMSESDASVSDTEEQPMNDMLIPEIPAVEAEHKADAEALETNVQTAETADGETMSTDPLQQARSIYTGISGEPQNVTSTTDTFQQIQQMANVITNAVVGATITVDFAEGESEKYIAIDVLDNGEGDGIRYFYLMLGEPYGTTTNSAASSCAVTILDDEEQAPSVIRFNEESYHAEGDTLTVEIVREGALNTIASAKLTTVNGSAQAGRDFSPVDMSVVFPMGIDKRTIDIPIRTEYFIGEADFGLKLEPENDCEIATESVTVTMNGTAAEVNADDEISIMAVEQSARVTDIELGDKIDLSKPEKKDQTSHFDGGNYYDSRGKQWYMEWIDNSWWYSYHGTVGASWNIANQNEVHIAGAQIDWARAGSCANMKVGFVSNTNLSWNSINYKADTDISVTGWVYNSRANFGNGTKTNVFSVFDAPPSPARITILNQANCDDCNRLWIHSITPIYRPFVINLQNAAPLKFMNADGSYTEWSDATFLALAGANNDTNNQIVRYAKDGKNAITFQQTIGKNVTTPYVYLKNIKMVHDGYTRTIASYGNDGATSHTLNIDKDWLKNNRSYIYFEENNASNSWKNQSGSFGLRGRIELKPEFGYKDAKVKINVPENDFGYFKVSGTDRNISSSQAFTYHMGDIIKLSTVMRDEYKDLYSPAGYMVSYKYNESDTNWVKRDVIVPYSEDGGTSQFLDDNKRLRYGYYEITPLFTRNDNAIVVRVRQDNLWMCDQSYGIFTTPYVEHTEIDGVKYNDYIVYNNPVYGKIYSLAARYGGGGRGCDYAFWKEPGSDRTYTGEVFFHEASNDPANNIIELSIKYDSYSDIYQDISGSVYRPSYNMSTMQVGYSNILPAQGAIVNFGTSFAVVDAEGNFKVPLFRSISDHSYSGEKHYIRYTIAYNGEESLREMPLSMSGYKYIVYTDVDSDVYYAAHIAWATENGIVDGYGDGLFGPDDLVTREQMAKMTANYLAYKTGITAEDTSLAYTDAADISDWATVPIALATQQGIMNGNDDGTFAPKSFATRAETAAVIERLDRLIVPLMDK